ncbi:DDHD domain-containing protein [Poronia punctata]|nr:DDHD domain-containing protein [Poronia punctata]
MSPNMSSYYYSGQYLGPPPRHNFGLQCRLAPVKHRFPADPTREDIPPVKAQFFYCSPTPIDDPLSAIAAPPDTRSTRAALQPFSPGDNNALETAWLSLATDDYQQNHDCAYRQKTPSPSLERANKERIAVIARHFALKHAAKHTRDGYARDSEFPVDRTAPSIDGSLPLCCPELLVEVGLALRNSFCAVARRKQDMLTTESVAQMVMAEMQSMRTDSSAVVPETRKKSNSVSGGLVESKYDSPGPSRGGIDTFGSAKASLPNDGITGKPFVRVGTPEATTVPTSSFPRTPAFPPPTPTPDEKRPTQPSHEARPSSTELDDTPGLKSVEVPVGVSRLHMVTLPALQMKPIYWSPVNDLATVLRATWFYRDDMRPIDPGVANQLEAGYRELKPHAETWKDELRCAVEVGPLGEEKVSHPLWPSPPTSSSKKAAESDLAEPLVSNDPFCAARCFRGEAAAEGSILPSANQGNSSPLPSQKKFEHYHVIYKDEKNAFLLKPSLKPSGYYGRRPVAKIVRGMTIGVPVVRGFNYEVWKSKHQKRQTHQQMVSQGQPLSGNDDGGMRSDDICPACKAEKERSRPCVVCDATPKAYNNLDEPPPQERWLTGLWPSHSLVLVVHGIGQKLAERVENYHFTHYINAFRRAMNVELNNNAVRAVLRDEQNGIMVLPINWRQDLSLEDGGPMGGEDKAKYAGQPFSLKDIEPKTIPAVRTMISDVMFDVPFYMSNHKPKMVAALVGEANRVYRLWCRNNPGFSQSGRVHLIGHSLGSVMSVEVLSRQPTNPPVLDPARPLQTNFFEFDTKNLFLLGSPVAFFLLLERGALLPRRGRHKAGADTTDIVSGDVVGEAGQFGCLAVDNIYNIMAREDPVAYLLNGTIDPKYASGLKTAYVPSATPSLLQSVGSAMLGLVPGATSTPPGAPGAPYAALAKPPAVRLPSQLELEVHDFSREEIAERKALLLNDNGQIDYFLKSGGGPLELQYLNMLSAHTSYWVNQDLIRMLCQEIGRKPGKENTLPALRAVKTTKRAVPTFG